MASFISSPTVFPSAEVDVKRIVGEMASKHGILDVNDPASSMVLLDRLVLEHSADDLVAGIRASMHDFEEAVRKVQTRAGQLVAADSMIGWLLGIEGCKTFDHGDAAQLLVGRDED
jgi:hypothetical protein